VSHEDAQAISLLRKIDFALWSKGEPYPPAFAKKFELTGRHRKIADNPATKRIIAEKAQLRSKIAGSPQLVKDFEFFLDKMGWHPEKFLQHVYWDSNMMHATPQTVVSTEKKQMWPIDRKSLQETVQNIQALAEQIERLSKTDFSPARTVILRDEKRMPIDPTEERYLLGAFRDLPYILRCFGGDLRRKICNQDQFWAREKEFWVSAVEGARRNSLYEQIRAKTGQYHTVRLHRLVSAAREVQGLPPINQRAFVVWLNKLKKRHAEKARPPASSPTQ